MGASLSLLAGAYLHEDFAAVYGDVWHALDAYAAGEPQSAPDLAREIADLLTSHDDKALADLLDRAGCAFDFEMYPGGVRAWLTEISRRVEEWLATHQQ